MALNPHAVAIYVNMSLVASPIELSQLVPGFVHVCDSFLSEGSSCVSAFDSEKIAQPNQPFQR